MASFEATAKQRSYYHSLTGQWLPRGTGKGKASKMIDAAKRGEFKKAADKVKVYGWRFSGLAAECLKPEMKVIRYAVDVNYSSVASQFATLAEAEAFARSRYPEAEIEISGSIREQYMD